MSEDGRIEAVKERLLAEIGVQSTSEYGERHLLGLLRDAVAAIDELDNGQRQLAHVAAELLPSRATPALSKEVREALEVALAALAVARSDTDFVREEAAATLRSFLSVSTEAHAE